MKYKTPRVAGRIVNLRQKVVQRPQTRTGPQSMWTKFEPEYLPTPPAEQATAARAICETDRP